MVAHKDNHTSEERTEQIRLKQPTTSDEDRTGGATKGTREGVANRTLLRTYPESPHLCNDISGITDKLTHSLMNHDYRARLEPTIRRQSASGHMPFGDQVCYIAYRY